MSVGPFFPHGRIQFHIFPSYTLPCQTASHKMSIPFLLVRSLQALECCNEVSLLFYKFFFFFFFKAYIPQPFSSWWYLFLYVFDISITCNSLYLELALQNLPWHSNASLSAFPCEKLLHGMTCMLYKWYLIPSTELGNQNHGAVPTRPSAVI